MKLSIIFTITVVSCTAVPLQNSVPDATVPVKPSHQQRQDGDDGDGVGEIELVGEQVSKIINGVLTGNFGQIFGGSTGFIEDQDTETGVSSILNSVSLPLNTLLVSGVQSGQKYYNITNPPSLLLSETTTTPQPPLVVLATLGPINGTKQVFALPEGPIVVNPVGTQQKLTPEVGVKGVQQPNPTGQGLQIIPQVLVPAKHGEDEDDDDSENETGDNVVGNKLRL